MKLLFLIFFITGCAQVFSPVPAPPIATNEALISLSWEEKPGRETWSKSLVTGISSDLDAYSAANDIQIFCPKYSTLDRSAQVKTFAELMVAMAYYESGHDPKTSFRECSTKSCKYSRGCFTHPTYGYCMKGNPKYDGGVVTSRGLLQMSISSSNDYGCGLLSSDDLHDPIKNLNCALIILKKQIKRTGGIAKASNYWAVVKESNPNNKIERIKDRVIKNVPACR